MLKLCVFVFLVTQNYAFLEAVKLAAAGGRILNGTDAKEGEFPFAVSLRLAQMENAHQCGASILNPNFILTAGHCVSCGPDGTTSADPEDFNIQYGLVTITTDDTNSVNISKIHCNNLTSIFDGPFFEALYDIAILELANPLSDNGDWAPATLSRTFNSTVQQEGVIIGWGYIDENLTSTNTLQKLTLDVYDDSVCGTATRGDWDHHVCVGVNGYGGPCWGDSGTAALVDGIQVGLTSYTTTVPPSCGHGNATHPTVYSRIEKYLDWIVNITPDVKTN